MIRYLREFVANSRNPGPRRGVNPGPERPDVDHFRQIVVDPLDPLESSGRLVLMRRRCV